MKFSYPLTQEMRIQLQTPTGLVRKLSASHKSLHEPSEGFETIFDHLTRSVLANTPNWSKTCRRLGLEEGSNRS